MVLTKLAALLFSTVLSLPPFIETGLTKHTFQKIGSLHKLCFTMHYIEPVVPPKIFTITLDCDTLTFNTAEENEYDNS